MTRAFFEALHADPWARDFLDLAALNARASGAVEEALQRIRGTARSDPHALRSTSIVVLGPPGAGKTHLFSRLRRRVGPRAVFIHIRPLVHAEMTPRFILGEVVRQLAFVTPQGIPQVSALVGSFLGQLGGLGSDFPSTVLSGYAGLEPSERNARLEALLEQVLALWPEVDEPYLLRLSRVPFEPGPTGRALLAWLSGRDCDVAQLERIGATASLGEEYAFAALRTLSAVAALGSPLVLVFDQLENLIDADGAGPRLRAYAHLAAECVDTLRGGVLVHLALDSEWERGIEPSFNASQRSRIVMRKELLALPRAAEREEFLRLLLERVPEPHEAFPWPLGAARLERLRSAPGLTPRLLLLEFRRALDGEIEEGVGAPAELASCDPDPISSADLAAAVSAAAEESGPRDIEAEWLAQLSSARDNVHAASEDRVPLDAARLADGLLALGRFIAGLGVRAEAKPPVCLAVEAQGSREALAILDQSNHRSIATVLTKLVAVSETVRVVVVRESARELPPTWKETLRKRSALLATGRARWVDVDPEDCARMLALAALLQAARSGEVTSAQGEQVEEREVCSWVSERIDVASWPISVELTAAPERAPAAAQGAAAGGAPVASTPSINAPVVAGSPAAGRAPLDNAPAVAGSPAGGRAPAASASVASARAASTLPTLRRLRVASFERLVREVLRVDPGSTRASILAELDAAGERVRWLGRSVVFLRSTE